MKKLKIASLTTLAVGIVVLVIGAVFLGIKNNEASQMGDADYLVEKGTWALEGDEGSVIWEFTEIGKGTLTTNNHLNDYDFEWALEDETLKITTDWLYEMDNEYTYEIDQGTGVMTLITEDETYTFVAQD